MEKYIPRIHNLKDEDYYWLLDENGNLKDEIKECVALCRDYDIVLGTGHISAEESMAVGRFAAEIGYHKVCLTHPRSHCCYNTFEQIQAFAQMGHFVEFCALNVAPLHSSMTIADICRIIEEAGADSATCPPTFLQTGRLLFPSRSLRYSAACWKPVWTMRSCRQ